MEASDLIGPAVVAAVIAGVVSTIGIWISARTTKSVHAEKLTFDRELAERKVNADIELAKTKLALDQGLINWKRRHELAEQALIVFYEARDVLAFARTRVIFRGEGKSRPVAPGESDELREKRESYFVPIERLNSEKAVFARL